MALDGVSEIRALQVIVKNWADRAFPARSALPRAEQVRQIITKLREELEELEANPEGEDEFADMQILLLDLAELMQHDIHRATVRKIAVNYERRWVLKPGGTYQHIIDVEASDAKGTEEATATRVFAEHHGSLSQE